MHAGDKALPAANRQGHDGGRQAQSSTDRFLAASVLVLLRVARRLSLLRRVEPAPGLAHARLTAALLSFEAGE